MMESFSDRVFKFWHYHISHGELLIRSHKNASHDKNIDIMFFDVIYIELPRNLSNIKIEKATEEEILHVNQKMDKTIKPENITILVSNDKRYLIVASFMIVEENELDMFELPFDTGFHCK